MPPSKQKRSKGRSDASGEEALSDPRFAKIQTDAVYRLPSKQQKHVSVDSRFAHMLDDEGFTSIAKVDRYGRALPKTKQSRNLERLYKVQKPTSSRKQRGPGNEGADEEEDEDEGDNDEVHDEADNDEEDGEGGVALAADEDVERKFDPARDGFDESSSSEDDTSDESEIEEDEEESGLAARQVEDVPEGEVSSRMAVVNLDWDNIRAVDLMAVLQSFAPRGERITKVTIYPSEFGKERLEREEVEGPPKELFQRRKPKAESGDFSGFSDSEDEDKDDEEDEDEDEDEDERIRKSLVQEDTGEDFDPDQLRQYQLERLRYYYAVVECSSDKCALEIYKTVDGTEYLSTANFFDLRFIPAETDFSDDKPRDACTKVPEDYAPNDFSTDALQHSKVKLTWDADDVNRKEAQRKAFSRAEIDANDLKAYLASDTEDDDDDEQGRGVEVVDATEEAGGTIVADDPPPKMSKKETERERMRKLLGLSSGAPTKKSNDEPVGDMEITFSSALGAGNGSVFENEPIPDETTVERYVRKERERKARRKEKMKSVRRGEAADEGDAGEKDPVDDGAEEDLGFDDPFFTQPVNDQKAAKEQRKEEKRKKRAERMAEEAQAATQRAELEKIMGEDGDDTATGIQHFDIDELRKAEKAAKRKGKKGRLRASEKAALEARAKDNFEIDTEDPRFRGVFEDSALALDPNNARFGKTQGMQKLLEAGRKKRARDADGDFDGHLPDKKKKASASADGDDLGRLVQRVKAKVK